MSIPDHRDHDLVLIISSRPTNLPITLISKNALSSSGQKDVKQNSPVITDWGLDQRAEKGGSWHLPAHGPPHYEFTPSTEPLSLDLLLLSRDLGIFICTICSMCTAAGCQPGKDSSSYL
jgi:hypothetical protein